MATDLKTEKTVESTVMGADLVTGAAVTVADNVARVVSHPVREAHKIERRGAEANKAIGAEIGELVETVMPERFALAGIRVIKGRARRKDLVGEVAYQWLRLVNGGLTQFGRSISRFERATEPPTRTADSATRTSKRTVRTTRSRVRRGASRARRQERATA